MTHRRSSRSLLVAATLLPTLGGCVANRFQNALEPAGRQAGHLETLWWIAFWIATVVYVVTMAAMAYAAFHARRTTRGSVLKENPEGEARSLRWIRLAAGTTVAMLFAFLLADLFTTRSLAALQREPAMLVKITGYQWWWKIQYVDKDPSRTLTTANELHIPVGRPVHIELTTGDVIHSFWVPSLNGKRDLVPGRKNELWIRADSVGEFRGQCAEFCGHQHAKMGLLVIADSTETFARWYNAQMQEASAPTDSVRAAGLTAFTSHACAVCHQIRGTPANGQVAPDLTHLGSRRMIAAGMLPNTKGHLGGWIVDPQSVKPGAKMPPNSLSSGELEALLEYLRGLK